MSALWSGHAGAARCRVLLSEWRVLWSGHAGAAAGVAASVRVMVERAWWCRCRVQLQGAAAGCCCQRCALWSGHAGAAVKVHGVCALV